MADNPLLGWGIATSSPAILRIAWVALGLVGTRPSLFQFFGYFGLFGASVLILRVIVAVLHDGLN